MANTRLINASAQGLRMSNAHTHWHEVNPIKRQTISPEERRERDKALTDKLKREANRRAILKANGSRILPALY
jgi:hypothetical protein